MSLSDKDKEEVKHAIEASIEAALGPYKVNKEQHYQDHLFLRELREWTNTIKITSIKFVVKAILGAIFILVAIGFYLRAS